MIILYFVALFTGVIIGVVLMALMAANRERTIHVYHEADGSISVLSDDPYIRVEHHNVE